MFFDKIYSISDFKFPDLSGIPKDHDMSEEDFLLCLKSSTKRLISNSEYFIKDIDLKLKSISRD